MIKFFRHFRKSFLDNNQMGKYFKYAIGEILLVVVGILLALQINNWNETRKANIFEKNMLKEIHTTVKNDIEFFSRLEDRMKKKDTAIDNLLFARVGKRKFSEERLRNDILWAGAGILFSYNKGPYEALKSSGLDKVSTDSLRYILTNHYEVYLPRAEAFFNYSKDEYRPKIDELEEQLNNRGFFEDYLELQVEDNIEKGYFTKTRYNIELYLTEPIYDEYLLVNANYKTELWSMIRNIISRTKKVSDALDLELKERFNDSN